MGRNVLYRYQERSVTKEVFLWIRFKDDVNTRMLDYRKNLSANESGGFLTIISKEGV